MKVFNYIILTLGMLFLLHIVGVDTGSTLLNIVGINEDGIFLDSSAFYNYLFGVSGILMLVVTGAGIVASLFTNAKAENFIILPFIGLYLVNFATALVSIIRYFMSGNVPSWIGIVVMAILGPLAVGLVFSLVEFFRGND